MRNIKLTIQYDGSKYLGWQKLGDTKNTIQDKIETVLSLLMDEKVEIIGSGRTDAGVHAENQIANFTTEKTTSLKEILHYCSTYLPQDIVIKSAEEVDEKFHSRYNAKGKTYTYRICNNKFHDVFTRKYSYHISSKLDINNMKEACKYLTGEHDFKSFTALKSKKKSTVRNIHSINIKESGDGNIDIIFRGNGFLYKMIRIIVGTLIEVGLHRLKPEDIKDILLKEDRIVAGPTAPSQGLFLTQVIY